MWHLIYFLINFACVEQSANLVAITNESSVSQSYLNLENFHFLNLLLLCFLHHSSLIQSMML